MLQFFLSVVFLIPTVCFAQSDFTRQIISSGRYEIKKSPGKPLRQPASEEGAPTPSETKVPERTKTETSTVSEEPKPVEIGSAPSKAITGEEPMVVDQVRTLFGEDDSAIRSYQDRIHPEDIRLNRLEIEGRAGFTSVDSASNYSFRDYQSSFATMDLKSNVWLVPSFGLTGSLRFSMGGSLRGDGATGSMDRVRDEEMTVGFLFRRHFGLSRLSPSMEFGLIYLDHSFNVSTDSISRPRWTSNGVGLSLKARMPSSEDHAWVLGGRIFPKMKHSESKTSISVQSGSPGENIRIDLGAGGELSFGRGSQFLYGLEIGAERDQFDGPASLPDPKTGSTPSNVTVTNALVNFSFGYRWGR